MYFYTKTYFTDAVVQNVFYCIKSIFLLCILNDFYRNLVSGRKFKMMTVVTLDDGFALILTSVDKYSFTTEVYLCIYRFT